MQSSKVLCGWIERRQEMYVVMSSPRAAPASAGAQPAVVSTSRRTAINRGFTNQFLRAPRLPTTRHTIVTRAMRNLGTLRAACDKSLILLATPTPAWLVCARERGSPGVRLDPLHR